MAVEGYT
jgi:hypothetical protein